jgi:hypothetical protein
MFADTLLARVMQVTSRDVEETGSRADADDSSIDFGHVMRVGGSVSRFSP